MSRMRLQRPSPAMVVALIALFVALAGSGYAAVTINGKNLKNRSVAGKKLMRNTVGGTEVNESRLGRVPSAANANLLAGLAPSAFLPAAGKAADADKLDGQDSTAFLGAAAKAADADKLDGQDSTAFLGAAAKAADADELDGQDSTAFLGAAAKAADADKLDGQDSTAFLGAAAKAADADELDGLDSTAFVQGSGRVQRIYASGANVDANRNVPGFGFFFLFCQNGNATMQFQNVTGGPVSLWRERASTSQLEFLEVANFGAPGIFINGYPSVTDRITLQVSNASASATWEAWVVANGSTCTFNVNETLN